MIQKGKNFNPIKRLQTQITSLNKKIILKNEITPHQSKKSLNKKKGRLLTQFFKDGLIKDFSRKVNAPESKKKQKINVSVKNIANNLQLLNNKNEERENKNNSEESHLKKCQPQKFGNASRNRTQMKSQTLIDQLKGIRSYLDNNGEDFVPIGAHSQPKQFYNEFFADFENNFKGNKPQKKQTIKCFKIKPSVKKNQFLVKNNLQAVTKLNSLKILKKDN